MLSQLYYSSCSTHIRMIQFCLCQSTSLLPFYLSPCPFDLKTASCLLWLSRGLCVCGAGVQRGVLKDSTGLTDNWDDGRGILQ